MKTRGFTLIELLVAAGITVLIAGVVVAVLIGFSSTFARTSGRLAAAAQARLALDQLTLDLQSALYRDDGATWLAASITNNVTQPSVNLWRSASTGVPKPSTSDQTRGTSVDLFARRAGLVIAGNATTAGPLSDVRYGVTGTWLRFFTVRRGSNSTTAAAALVDTASTPVAVGWQIIRRLPTGTAGSPSQDFRYFLHRAEVRSAADGGSRPGTLDTGFDITLAPYTNTSARNTGLPGDPWTISAPDTGSILAENVIDFGVRCYIYTTDANGTRILKQIFPATAASTRYTAKLPPRVKNGTDTFDDCFPEVVDVMVRVLTDEGATLIQGVEQNSAFAANRPAQYGNAAEWWWAIADAHSQVFTRRIVLPARAL
jgi:type II secretory pathway pseudopilin PulG